MYKGSANVYLIAQLYVPRREVCEWQVSEKESGVKDHKELVRSQGGDDRKRDEMREMREMRGEKER